MVVPVVPEHGAATVSPAEPRADSGGARVPDHLRFAQVWKSYDGCRPRLVGESVCHGMAQTENRASITLSPMPITLITTNPA